MADISKTIAIIIQGQDNASPQAKAVSAAIEGIGAASTSASTSMDRLGTAQGLSVEKLRQLQVQTAATQIATAKLTGDTDLLARGQTLLAAQFAYRGTKEEELLLRTGKLRAETDLAIAKTQKLGDETKEAGDKAASASAGTDKLVTALKALAASVVFKEFVDANIELEKFTRAMTLIKGSSDAAAEEFQYLSTLTRTLGISLFDAADAYVSLSAATKGTALEGAQTREIFEAVSVAMSSLGKSGQDTQSALLAITQIVSKGKVSMEELRGQLGERLPGAMQIAAEAMGVTTAELEKLVKGGISAEDFLPRFSAALKKTFGDVQPIEGFQQSLQRLKQTTDETYIQIGKAGAFDLLTDVLKAAAAGLVTATAGLQFFGEVFGQVAAAITTGNFSDIGNIWDESFSRLGDRLGPTYDALLGVNKEIAKTGAASSSAAQDVNLFAGDVAKYEAAQEAAAVATEKASKSSAEQVKALATQAKEAQRAEEATKKMALELEKIASNERIKNIEFKVELDIARLEEDTKRVQAAFDSINNTINSTGDVISSSLSLLKDFDSLDWGALRIIESQLEKENQLRREAFELQKELTEAQIRSLNAQTAQLEKGDVLIKIDGAGLQPHLEAFMFEILKAIQVRVNRDGLPFLLGT